MHCLDTGLYWRNCGSKELTPRGGANNDLDVFRSGKKKEKAEKEAHEGHGKVNCKVDCKVNCKVSCKVSCTVTAMSLGGSRLMDAGFCWG